MALGNLLTKWNCYSSFEKRNIIIYIAGIMFYKLGLETFQGSTTILALERWGDEKHQKYGLLRGLDLLFQCLGSILVAPLVNRFPARNVLMCAVAMFGAITGSLMILDWRTGGAIKRVHGNFSADVLFPIVCCSGVFYGMVEVIRRVIPRDIVGGDISKLRRMDALVHIFYEVSGTAGAFTSFSLIYNFGSVYSLLLTPLFFFLSMITWYFLGRLRFTPDPELCNTSYAIQLRDGVSCFFKSIQTGARIVLKDRKFVWLPVGYSLALYGHRYLENGIIPIVSEGLFRAPGYSQILIGGSNMGELVGAFTVFCVGDSVPTPIPWLRGDAILVLLVWVLPHFLSGAPVTGPPVDVRYAWALAPLFLPISFGWAAGDVSLAAYIQAALPEKPNDSGISSLSAVMAFLYSTYIVIFAILSPLLGKQVDKMENPRDTIFYIGAVQFTLIGFVLFCSTLVPKGALLLNPKLQYDEGVDLGALPVEGEKLVEIRRSLGAEPGGKDSEVVPVVPVGGKDPKAPIDAGIR